MSHRDGDVYIAEEEKPQQCDDCGLIKGSHPSVPWPRTLFYYGSR